MEPETHEISIWRDRLRRRADIWLARAGGSPSGPVFASLSVEPYFQAWRRGVSPSPPPPPADAAPDVALWGALVAPSAPVILEPGSARAPIAPRSAYRTIEAWTEADLSAMHALWWLGHRRGRPEWVNRALHAAEWHIEHVQPDNATNRPWAIHVFLDLWRQRGSLDARMHAETLLHNVDAGAGTTEAGPGLLIAHIAADAADGIEWILKAE